MKTLNIFLGNTLSYKIDGDIIAVDNFATTLINKGYKDFVAIGDFDSCSSEEFSVIKNNCNVIEFPEKKDYGDLELAFKYAIDNDYKEVIVHNIFCGNRVDHLLNNFFIYKKYKDNFELDIKDNNNFAYFLKNSNVINKNDFKYISLFILEDVKQLNISEDFKYSYLGDVSAYDTRFISNELCNSTGKIDFVSGEILIIFSND